MTDHEAFCLRAESYRGPLLQLINRSLAVAVRRRFDAEDVLQEMLAPCPANVAELLMLPDARFHGWLRKVAQRRLCDLQRWHLDSKRRDPRREISDGSDKAGVNPLAGLKAEQPGAHERLEAAERSEFLERGMKALSEDDQLLLRLHYLEELPAQEVAARLELSMETCRKRDYRARLMLMILLLRLQA
jgi:RNA polymerase sigma factor (sigma-70 family)